MQKATGVWKVKQPAHQAATPRVGVIRSAPLAPLVPRIAAGQFGLNLGILLTPEVAEIVGDIDSAGLLTHFPSMKSLLEIEEAIAKLPKESQQQLFRDLPSLCPEVFPVDGWDSILADPTPRPALTSLLDQLEADYRQHPAKFMAVNENTLGEDK